MENPTVSVVIPAFNAGKYIGVVLDGMNKQKYSNWELIVVDDQSTDDTQAIVHEYSKQDPRIKLYVRDRLPKGAQTCRNTGIDKATGKYLIIIDADDVVSESFLSQRVQYMDNHPELDYISFPGKSFVMEDNKMKILERRWGFESQYNDLLIGFLKASYPFGVWNNIYKADVVRQIMFDENVMVYQDFDFLVRTILHGFKHSFAEGAEPDYFYRQGHTGTITSNFISGEKYESTKRLFEKIMLLLKKTNQYDIYQKFFFDFFLLQYERVLIKGDNQQGEDFYDFITNYYGEQYKLRLHLMKILVSYGKKPFSSKRVFFSAYILFQPYKLMEWIKGKFN